MPGAVVSIVKVLLADKVNAYFLLFRERRAALAADPKMVTDVLSDGAKRATSYRPETLKAVKQSMGLL